MAGYRISAHLPHLKTACDINACLANGASAAAARTAAKAAKPNHAKGEIPDTLVDAWDAVQISATDLTLAGSAAVEWVQGYMPVAGLGFKGA